MGGEGSSELGYLRWLNRLAAREEIRIAFTTKSLKSGDPLELVESAIARLAVEKRKGVNFRHRALLEDHDGLGANHDRDQQAYALAQRHKLTLIWQTPCHEGFLLRHFEAPVRQRLRTASQALQALNRIWPGYRKGMSAIDYEKFLTLDHLARARAAEAEFDRFLTSIGWR